VLSETNVPRWDSDLSCVHSLRTGHVKVLYVQSCRYSERSLLGFKVLRLPLFVVIRIWRRLRWTGAWMGRYSNLQFIECRKSYVFVRDIYFAAPLDSTARGGGTTRFPPPPPARYVPAYKYQQRCWQTSFSDESFVSYLQSWKNLEEMDGVLLWVRLH
jgi:hypothetical protein